MRVAPHLVAALCATVTEARHWLLLLPAVPVNPVVHAAQVSVTVQVPRRSAVQSGEQDTATGSLSMMVVATVVEDTPVYAASLLL